MKIVNFIKVSTRYTIYWFTQKVRHKSYYLSILTFSSMKVKLIKLLKHASPTLLNFLTIGFIIGIGRLPQGPVYDLGLNIVFWDWQWFRALCFREPRLGLIFITSWRFLFQVVHLPFLLPRCSLSLLRRFLFWFKCPQKFILWLMSFMIHVLETISELYW